MASELENYFKPYRENIAGYGKSILTPYGKMPLTYADWTASGRIYNPIESFLQREIMPFVANTHTETTTTGTLMTRAYHEARKTIKQHVNASDDDALIFAGSGMTGAINKFQRILGLKMYERTADYIDFDKTCADFKPDARPVVFITHMEHHSNHTSWIETLVDLEIIEPTSEGLTNLEHFKALLEKHKNRKYKFASVTACSNVTGITTPYYEIARLIHQYNGFCFVDFACSAPYVLIDMHPEDQETHLDAIFFSPHKFLGGPGTEGVMIFNKKLYKNTVPDCPGGGTVKYTNPWNLHRYVDDIEEREDGGTPPFLQAIRTALAIKLKEKIGTKKMLQREEEIIKNIFIKLNTLPNLHILAGENQQRMGVISFYIDGLHYNLGVKLLNDRFGIQTRGGCACAGTYGHYLLHVDQEQSLKILDEIEHGNISTKPGWIRLSIHPVMTDAEIEYITDAIEQLSHNHKQWSSDYNYDPKTNVFNHISGYKPEPETAKLWFDNAFKTNSFNKKFRLW